MGTVIENVRIVTLDPNQPDVIDGVIAVENDCIRYIGTAAGAPAGFDWVDGRGRVVMPGFINAHTHAPMAILRGFADDLPLHEWLEQRVFPVEDRLTDEDAYWASMLSIVEMLRGGTTCFLDMYFHMDAVARAVADSGIRAVLSRGLVSEDGARKLQEGLDFARSWSGGAEGRITAMLGPHAPYTCTPGFLREVAGESKKSGFSIHIHVSETERENRQIREQFGRSPVELLADCGILERPVVAAHCVHVSDRDIAILAEADAVVAHCPASNLKLASGIAPVSAMRAAGVAVGIGTDSSASNNVLDMFAETRLASLMAKGMTRNPTELPAKKALELATCGSAMAARLHGQVGQLIPGMKADLIMVDLERPHLTPHENPMSLLVYSARADDVTDTMVNGKWVMRDRQFLAIDEHGVRERVNRSIRRIAGQL